MRRVLLLAALLVPAGCVRGDPDASGCGPVLRERHDPNSAVHLLPGASMPEYLSDPPTSGAHRSGRPPTGVQDEPVERPVQVLVLESGGVLLQHDGLEEPEREALEALAGPDVVVAPNADLDDPVVATAWLTKQTCDAVDVDVLAEFVDEHRGRAGH